MIKSDSANIDFEILISTMKRNSLKFIESMFPVNNYLDYNVLIINQTDRQNLLTSSYKNIRVINSFEKGLPQSRNLALKNAKGIICLIADDDVVYKADFESIIKEAYKKHIAADMITFKMTDEKGESFRDYKSIVKHDKKSIQTANSVVISFKKDRLIDYKVKFNENFGLGTTFETANEYVFLRNALKASLNIFFEPKIILSHPSYSSGQDMGSDRIVFARAALYYKYSGYLGYIRLVKYLYLVHKKGAISFEDFYSKLLVGLKGINKYKFLVNKGLETR